MSLCIALGVNGAFIDGLFNSENCKRASYFAFGENHYADQHYVRIYCIYKFVLFPHGTTSPHADAFREMLQLLSIIDPETNDFRLESTRMAIQVFEEALAPFRQMFNDHHKVSIETQTVVRAMLKPWPIDREVLPLHQCHSPKRKYSGYR